MTKKKFSLTSDLIEVMKSDDTANHQTTSSQILVAKKSASKKEQVLITIAIEEELKDEFKIWCVKHKLKMREAFIEGFELLQAKYN